jgi:hypothetical protein
VKSFAQGQAVEIRLRRNKNWIAAKYIKATEYNGVSGWHRVLLTGDGESETVPDARIRKIATPVSTTALASATEKIVRARLVEAGLELQAGPCDFFTTTEGRSCTVRIIVPVALLDEQLRVDAEGGGGP